MGDLLPGQLAYVFSISILDAALLSWLTLRWRRHSLRALMRGRGPKGAAPAPAPAPAPLVMHAAGEASLDFALFGSTRSRPSRLVAPAEQRVHLRRLILAYCLGAALHSGVITPLKFGAETQTLPFVAWFGQWWINTWPVVPTLVALLVLDRATTFRLAMGYVVVGCVALALITLAGQVVRGSLTSAPLTNMYWLIVGLLWTAFVPLTLVLITGWRRIRAVTPLALAATLVFGFALMFFREALARAFNLSVVRAAVLGLAARSSTEAMYYGLFMVVALPVGWLAWRLLRGLAASFDRKRFSDVQLVIDCWWLIVTADEVTVALPMTSGLVGIAGGLVAFLVYRLGVALVLRGSPLERGAQPSPSEAPEGSPRSGPPSESERGWGPASSKSRLLLLRVFGYQARTESLFDRVAERWRFHGPVQLIAGVDLAMRTADPGDILAFVSGHLADQYVATPEEVPRRLNGLDLRRDPDGRFRVNEVYCHDGTWQPALQALLDVSDTVLMDLRSFSERNAGCIFELEQIVRRVPTDSIVLVCDCTTDLRLLGGILSEAWGRARVEGRARGAGRVDLVRIERGSRRELSVLMQRLLGRGEPQQVLALAELPAPLA